MRRLAALAPILLVALLSGIAGALDGSPPANTGWWSRDPTAAEQPAGGFQISSVAGEPVSVAALRFQVSSGVTTANLSLQESGGFVTPAAGLQVCKTTEPWEPANPGAYDDAPTPDCASPVDLERDAEARIWSAPVSSLVPTVGGEVSLMILPSESAGGGAPLDPGFQVTFSGSALEVVSAPGTTSGPPTTFSSPSSPSFGGGDGGGGGFGGTPSFTPPGSATAATTIAPTTPDTVPDSAAGGEAFMPPELAGGATPGGGTDQPWERLLILVPVSAAVGVGMVFGRRLLERRGVLEEA